MSTTQDWKKKTVAQAIIDGEGTATLHMDRHIHFWTPDNEVDQTDKYGDYEFDLDSFFACNTLGHDEDSKVGDVLTDAWQYITTHELTEKEYNKHYGIETEEED